MAEQRVKNATRDVPDLRDRMYEPALVQLASEIRPDVRPEDILDQGFEGACTGFALAAVINHLSRRAERESGGVSSRMLYEMAKRNDEWPGEDYDGSSLRGVIRGWKNNGVCSEKMWRYRKQVGRLTIARAKDARSNAVGAYYRIRPVISDVHAALNEVGIIAVSAQVHRGWDEPKRVIRFYKKNDGGHAFAIVGYNERGFWVQNSWGVEWAQNGLALWTYEDWVRNVMDAWVVRLALPTPQIFAAEPRSAIALEEVAEPQKRAKVARMKIAGHFVHIDDGQFHDSGRYWSDDKDVKQTAELVAQSGEYEHLLVYAHGGLNSPDDSARRIHAMKDGFKRNGIYPFHVMYDTGLAEELKDLLFRKGRAAKQRVGGFTDWTDRFLEGLLRRPGRMVWEEMKQDAFDAFSPGGAGTKSLEHFLKQLLAPLATKKQIHLVGHSTGGVLIAHLLHALRNEDVRIESCTLLGPACTVDLYHQRYVPALTGKTKLTLAGLQVLNLRDRLERDDDVATVYRKSLLYLVSNAFEQDRPEPLLGMEKFAEIVDEAGGKRIFRYSNGVSGNVTRSRSHGGFDNDETTMNHVLATILGKRPSQPFTGVELRY